MSPNDYNHLLQTALTLPPNLRTQLVQTLLESLDRPSPQPTIQSNHSDRWFATLPKRIDPLEFQRSIRSEWDD